MGTVPRIGLRSGDRLFDATKSVDDYFFWDLLFSSWQQPKLNGATWNWLRFVPGSPSEFYVAASLYNTLARCGPDPKNSLKVLCSEIHAAAWAPQRAWVTPANPQFLYLHAKSSGAGSNNELQLSMDGGKSFQAIAHPFGTQALQPGPLPLR